MHPANQVAVPFDDHPVAEITHPWRHRQTYRWPFIRRALRIAFELNRIIVELDEAMTELSLAKTGARSDDIDNLTIGLKNCVNVVKIAVTPAPEIEVVNSRAGEQSLRFARSNSLRSAIDRLDCPSVRIGDRYLEVAGLRRRMLVLHLRFRSDRCATAGDIKVACVNVHAGSAQARIERQSLI